MKLSDQLRQYVPEIRTDCGDMQIADAVARAADELDPLSAEPASKPEVVAWMFQHEETGGIVFAEAWQMDNGFEKSNPRLQKIAALTRCDTSSKAEDASVVSQQLTTETSSKSAHPDDAAVDRFSVAMKEKLAAARAKGRGGWDDPVQCTIEYLSDLLRSHVEKGDPVDVANFCMMLQQRESGIVVAPVPAQPAAPVTDQAKDAPIFTSAAVFAAARAMADRHAGRCNIDKEDNWKIYGGDYIEDAEIALNAAIAASKEPQS